MKKKNNFNGCIYLATNKENNKKYIGATTISIDARKKDHIQKSNKNSGHDFQDAIATYGEKAFTWIEIDTANSIEELAYKEKYYIKKYDSFSNGYNSDLGGGFRKPIYQYTLTGELLNVFKCLNDAANSVNTDKKTISKTCLSVNQIHNNSLWSYEYQIPYISNIDNRFKKVVQLSIDKEYIASFKSISEASKITGINKSGISKVCRKERKTTGGFIFRFKKDEVLYPYISSSSLSSPFIYVTNKDTTSNNSNNPYFTTYTRNINEFTSEDINTQFAPFYNFIENTYIPKKAEFNLRKYVPKRSLERISKKNENEAVEKSLIVLSNLSSTYYAENEWKKLSSKILHEQTKKEHDNTFIYAYIINTLKKGTKRRGSFIEVRKNKDGKEKYEVGKTSKEYCLSDTYKKGLIEYKFKDEGIIKRRREFYTKSILESCKDEICRNLLTVTLRITLPKEEELLEEAKILVKAPTYSNKGKKLTFRNKHSNSHWKDHKKRSFIEDDIKLYKFLTKPLRIPKVGTAKSGGRVVDSFTLMPSWIRNLIKIDGKFIEILDYSCLHPNLAIKIYGGKGSSINHTDVANYLGIPRQKAKIEHLSFFNKRWKMMKKSPLFKYYKDKEPIMLEAIKKDKLLHGHKITSRRLFKEEVELMREVIKELNSLDIFVGYVYDALFCNPNDKEIVKKIMDATALKLSINTHV